MKNNKSVLILLAFLIFSNSLVSLRFLILCFKMDAIFSHSLLQNLTMILMLGLPRLWPNFISRGTKRLDMIGCNLETWVWPLPINKYKRWVAYFSICICLTSFITLIPSVSSLSSNRFRYHISELDDRDCLCLPMLRIALDGNGLDLFFNEDLRNFDIKWLDELWKKSFCKNKNRLNEFLFVLIDEIYLNLDLQSEVHLLHELLHYFCMHSNEIWVKTRYIYKVSFVHV